MRSIDLNTRDEVTPLVDVSGAGYRLTSSRKTVVDRIVYRHSIPESLLHVTLAGRMRRFVGRFGAREPVISTSRPGCLSFAPPGWDRFGSLEDGTVVAVEIAIHPDMIAEASEQPVDLERTGGFFNASDPKVAALVQAIVGLDDRKPDSTAQDTLVHTLARHVGKRMGGADFRRDDGWIHPAALRRVVERADADPANPPRLDELARLAGLGQSAFIRAFRGATGATPADFFQRRRLGQAREAILRSESSIELIALDHGFSSKGHFITAFRRHFGVTPGKVRSEYRTVL